MSPGVFTACERLLSATANGVYQGVLVAALAGITLRFFARTNAATRHAVWFGVLLFVTALIPAHLLLSWRSRPAVLAAAAQTAAGKIAIETAAPNAGNLAGSSAAIPAFTDQTSQPDTDSLEGRAASPAGATQDEWAGGSTGSKGPLQAGAMEEAWSRFARAIQQPFSWNVNTAIGLPHSICVSLVSAWLLFAIIRLGLIVERIGAVRRVKRMSAAPNPGLQNRFGRLGGTLAVRRNVRLRISSTHPTPGLLGFLHPVVILPADMEQDANESEMEHVLQHELAHLNRWDDWGCLVQQCLEAALFFHPAVWWISARITLEREIACDDHVLEASDRPRSYALTLVNFAVRMTRCRRLLAPGVSSNTNSQLQKRINMILDTHRDRSPRLARSRLGLFTTATALLAVLAINAGPRLVLAQSPAETRAAAEPREIAPPPAPEAPDADGSPAALPPDRSETESGPRTKSGQADNDRAPRKPTPPGALAASTAAPADALEPLPPTASALPTPPRPPANLRRDRSMSVEARLDRIERVLEELESRDGVKGRRSGEGFVNVRPNRPEVLGDMAMGPDREAAMKRAAEKADRAAEAGQRAAEAAQRSVERAERDIAKLKSKDFARMSEDKRGMQLEGPNQQLQALRGAREALAREVQNLERQIKRLEEEQSRQKQATHVGDDGPEDGSQPNLLKK